MAPNKKVLLGQSRCGLLHFCTNWMLVAVWVTVTGILFSWAYFRYHHEPRYFYTRQILGQWLCVSRGTAAVLHLCMACIVFPVSRFLHLIIARVSVPRKMPKICTSILMHSKRFHLICALTLIIASVVHTISHAVNAYNFSTNYNFEHPEVNWGKPGQSAPSLVFSSVAGISGLGMLLFLFLMAFTSMEGARNSHYNYFWLSHHLALPLLLLYLVHPLSHVIKELANIEQHNPEYCALNFTISHHNSRYNKGECKTPVFQSPPSNTWKWLLIPILLMILDLIMRLASHFGNSKCSSVAALPGEAVEISLSCPGLKCSPGQYILLQVPKVSTLEWHPFTIVKCPSDKDQKLSVIVKARGDWTRRVCKELVTQFIIHGNRENTESARVFMFGPFASPMEQMVHCKNLVCVGAGVGATPFMAFLKYLLDQKTTTVEQLKLLWLCPDPSQLLWFSWTLSSLHNKFWEQNKPELFNFSIHVTRNYHKGSSLESLMQSKYPLVASRTFRKRPDWEAFFSDVKSDFSAKEQVQIFGCGSQKLMKELDIRAKTISNGKTKFRFIQEAYS